MTTKDPGITPEQRELVKAYERAAERKRKGERGLRERVKREQENLSTPQQRDDWNVFSGEPE